MPVSLTKPGDTPADAPPANRLYITVAQLPDGRVSGVELGTTAPEPMELWPRKPRATVWTSAFPEQTIPLPGMEDDAASAAKVLDLANSPYYREEDGEQWATGEHIVHAFQHDHDDERRFLRTVEAHLIRAGVTAVHTGMVACQTHGITYDGGGDEQYVYAGTTGWRLASEDYWSEDGRCEQPYPIAPAGVSARRLAAIFLGYMLAWGEINPEQITPLYRLRARYNRWRITPNWRNFKFRTRQRLGQWRYRITKRVTARIPR
ncbi:hypothetical protein ABZ352_18785 [Streptomyces griseofuscus]|uniref:hypothetical protein n=1 Tax=Streptomyces griseofuscus TaxID=146922 RepID=UPI003411588E